MSETEASYYERRAEQELELAQRATDPLVVAAHYRLSELYLEKIAAAQRETAADVQPSDQGDHV